MPKFADRLVLIRSYQLRRQGLTLDRIVDKLSLEFSLERIPDRATIARNLKRFEERPPEELEEDTAFDWTGVTDVNGYRKMLDVYAYYECMFNKDYSGPMTKRLAKWVWRVLNALSCHDGELFTSFQVAELHWRDYVGASGTLSAYKLGGSIPGEPTENDILYIAKEYAWREIDSTLYGTPKNNKDIDAWLAFKPWESPSRALRYVKWRSANEMPSVTWHWLDADWLDKVDLLASTNHRTYMDEHFPGRNESHESVIWKEVMDVLLRSQIYASTLLDWDFTRDGIPQYPKIAWFVHYFLWGMEKSISGNMESLADYQAVLEDMVGVE